jgi:hypothetical protein
MLMATAMRELTVRLPEEIAEMITQTATSRSQSPDEVVAEALRVSLQPLAQQATQQLNREIERLQNKTTKELESLLDVGLPDKEQERLSELLQFNRERELSPEEQAELKEFRRKIEAVATRKAATIWLLSRRKK